MVAYIVFGAIAISWLWITYEIKNAPEEKDEEYSSEDYYDDDDPTTTCWHDDDYHPDSKI